MQETRVQSLGWKDTLEKGVVIHCSIPAWRIPWTEEPGGLQSMGCKELDTTERLTLWLSNGSGEPAPPVLVPKELQAAVWPHQVPPSFWVRFCHQETREESLRSRLHQDLPPAWSEVKVKVTQSCPTLCNPVHGILQARIQEWVAFPFSRGSSQPRDQTQVSCTVGRFFTSWATRETQEHWGGYPIPFPADLPDPGIKPGSSALQAVLYQLSYDPPAYPTGFCIILKLHHCK